MRPTKKETKKCGINLMENFRDKNIKYYSTIL